MALSDRWDVAALRAGGGVCLVFAVPLSLAARWAADSRDDGGLATLLSLGALVGFVIGSGVAGWVQRKGLPLAHAIVTAIVAYVGAQAVFILVRALTGREIRWYAALFNVAPVAGAGLFGGFLALRLLNRGVRPRAHWGSDDTSDG